MRILIETSGGGGVVLIIVLALIAGHGGGIDAAVTVGVIGLVVVVVLAVAATVVALVLHGRRENPPSRGFAPLPVVRVSPEPGELGTQSRALDAPVRLADDQLEQLAEIIRRHQRPEQ